MIKVVFFLEGQPGREPFISGFEIKGHALYSTDGPDLVCAAVSSLAQGTLNALTDEAGLKDLTTWEISDGRMQLMTNFDQGTEVQVHDGQLLYRSLLLNLEGLADQFPDHIEISRRYRDDSV